MQKSITLPDNIRTGDEPYFNPHLTWQYQDPILKKTVARIVISNGLVLSPLFKQDPIISPWKTYYQNHRMSYFLGQFFKRLTQTTIIKSNDTYIICNTFSNNFFHWITEVLPKIGYVSQKDTNACFFIPYKKLTSFQHFTLKKLGVKYMLAKNECSVVLNATVVGNSNEFPGYYHPDLLSQLKIKLLPLNTIKEPTRMVYITRKNATRRKLINEVEIEHLLTKYQIDVYDFDELDFWRQIEICSTAKLLISIHGAALTHITFMQKGCSIVEFLPENKLIDKCYFTLAKTIGLKYYYVFCKTDNDNHIVANYEISPHNFDNLLSNILK